MKKIFSFLLMFFGFFAVASLGVNAEVTNVTDELTYTSLGIGSGSGYSTFSDISVTSEAKYEVNANKGVAYVQLRSTSPSGIVSTVSGGTIVSVSVEWNAAKSTNTSRKVTIYGKNEAYTSSADLYDANAKGTEIGSAAVSEGTKTVTATESYKYVGILANGALYLDKITVVWAYDSSVVSYTTDFKMNDGTDTTIKSVIANSGDNVPFPTDPIRSGYTFAGWYDQAEGGNKLTSLTAAANTSVYAQWTQDSYTLAHINSANFDILDDTQTSSYSKYNGEHTLEGHFKYTTNQVMVGDNNILQLQKETGYIYNSSTVTGYIGKITLSVIQGTFSIYSGTTPIIETPTEATGTFENGVYTPTNSTDTYFRIVNGATTGQLNWFDVSYTYNEDIVEKYSVSFNVNGGTFADGKGETITEVVGTPTEVTLPKVSDLVQTAYNYTTLVGWTDGTETYNPGTVLEISSNKIFTAVYEVPARITCAQAMEIAEMAGSGNTTYKFTVEATVDAITTAYSSSYNNISIALKDETGTIECFRLTGGQYMSVGDVIVVTGTIGGYYDQFNQGSTYTTVSHVLGTQFETENTMASLKVDYNRPSLTVTDVDMKFGGIISADSYNANAKYGMIILGAEDADLLAGSAATAAELVGSNAIVQAECTLTAVDGGYQIEAILDEIEMDYGYDYSFVAVIYMEFDGTLYLASTRSGSVESIAQDYKDGGYVGISEEVSNVLAGLLA